MSIKANSPSGTLLSIASKLATSEPARKLGSELGRVALDSGVKALGRTAEGLLGKIGQRTSGAGMAPRQNVDLGAMGRASMMKAGYSQAGGFQPMRVDGRQDEAASSSELIQHGREPAVPDRKPQPYAMTGAGGSLHGGHAPGSAMKEVLGSTVRTAVSQLQDASLSQLRTGVHAMSTKMDGKAASLASAAGASGAQLAGSLLRPLGQSLLGSLGAKLKTVAEQSAEAEAAEARPAKPSAATVHASGVETTEVKLPPLTYATAMQAIGLPPDAPLFRILGFKTTPFVPHEFKGALDRIVNARPHDYQGKLAHLRNRADSTIDIADQHERDLKARFESHPQWPEINNFLRDARAQFESQLQSELAQIDAAEAKLRPQPGAAKLDAARTLLGVQADSKSIDIKKAWIKASQTEHPDRNPDRSEAESNERMQAVNDAYDLLKYRA